MNSTFLVRIRDLGIGKAGWYRAAQSSGMAVIGPWLGTLVTGSASFLLAYLCLAGMFAFMAAWSQNFLPTDAPSPPSAPADGVLSEIRQMLSDLWVGETALFSDHAPCSIPVDADRRAAGRILCLDGNGRGGAAVHGRTGPWRDHGACSAPGENGRRYRLSDFHRRARLHDERCVRRLGPAGAAMARKWIGAWACTSNQHRRRAQPGCAIWPL